jgi:hypothetical protein
VNRLILDGARCSIEGPEDLASDSGLLSDRAERPGALPQIDEVGKLLKVVSPHSRRRDQPTGSRSCEVETGA